MLKRFFACAAAFLLLCAAGCGPAAGTPGASTTGTAGTAGQSPTTAPGATATQKPAEEASLYGDGKGANLLVGIDEFGRALSPVYQARQGKAVGMFYWLWHGSYPNKIVNTSALLAEHGLPYVVNKVDEYNPTRQPHYWGEPLYGYYSSQDEYILRKHLEQLTYAGVDFIVFDATNTITYPQVVNKICKIVVEMRKEGFMAPQIAYFTHTASIQTVQQAYNEIYRKEEYSEAWYRVDGKPLMIAQTDPAKDKERTTGQHAHLSGYNPSPLPQKVQDFFYFRTPAWVGIDGPTENSWPWVDWEYPQQKYGNVMSVSPASHHWAMFSWAAMPASERPSAVWSGGKISWGRGFSFKTGKNESTQATEGPFYQSQWKTVLREDPDFVFIGGWNEWMCGVDYNQEYKVFQWYDSFNMEFSRDLEPMKGGYNDAFLLQTAKNIRDYKYTQAEKLKPAVQKTIDITAGAAQWQEVDAVYRFIGATNYGRNAQGAVEGLSYQTPAAQNSLQEVKITTDKENIYFLIRTDGNITLTGKENCMNLFIGTGTPAAKGFEGYEFVLNRKISGGKTTIEKLESGYKTTPAGEAQINVSGEYMQIALPRSALSLSETNNTFYFKVADSVENPADIMDYYVTGRSMPMGRFSYQYLG